MTKLIFVKIASYCDPELVPTMLDCLGKADRPENLRFGICWQHREGEALPELCRGVQFRVVDALWHESKGLGWARNECQRLYGGEDYTLQLDAHHRFAKGWDAALIEMLHGTGSEMPMLTAHPPGYIPGSNALLGSSPSVICGKHFTELGAIRYRARPMENWQNLSKPPRGRFVGGGFYFTLGRHCMDYQYDPEMYFAEEEICLALRSYTMGYDLFHPHRSVVWHHYSSDRFRPRSEDHSIDAKAGGIVESSWIDRMKAGKKRLMQLLGTRDYGLDLGIHGLGNARSASDYEKYAGVKFKEQLLHIDAIRGTEPPSPNCYREKGFSRIKTFSLDFDLSGHSAGTISKSATRISIGLADFQHDAVWIKKLSPKQIHNAIKNNRIQIKVTLKPKKRIASWFILAKDYAGQNEPIIVWIKDNIS